MSHDWVKDIAEMHAKFGVNEAVKKMDKEKLLAYLCFRVNFLQEELDEIKKATPDEGDEIVDGLIDLCVVAIGTLDAYGVDAYAAWDRVHAANIAKEVGIKKERPNKLGLPDLVKGPSWVPPCHKDNQGLIPLAMEKAKEIQNQQQQLPLTDSSSNG
jgi:hypothetical protein